MTAQTPVAPDVQESESIAAIRSIVREITGKYDRAYWLGCVRDDRRPTELIAALAEAGMFGIGVPEELGGSGGGMLEETVLIETLGLAGLPQGYLLVPNFCRRMVLANGTPQQVERFVAASLTGQTRTAFAITEAESGTNSFAMRTRAVKHGDTWRISGEKVYITEAGSSSQMLLVARTDEPGSPRAELSLFILDLPDPRITMTAMDMPATLPERQYIVHLDDVEIAESAVVGQVGEGSRSMFAALNPERILVAAGVGGLGRFALERGVEYVKTRAPFGRPTGSYQSVQHPLARAHVKLEAARLMTYESARAVDRGEDPTILASSAKLLASEAAFAAVDAAVQVHGGSAFDRSTDVFSLFEMIRQRRVAPVNNEMILNLVSERALGLPRSY